MLRSQVTIRTVNKGQEVQNWFIFESDHDSLADFNDCLLDDGTIYGLRIETEPVGNTGKRRIRGRSEFILTKDALVTAISPPQFELVE